MMLLQFIKSIFSLKKKQAPATIEQEVLRLLRERSPIAAKALLVPLLADNNPPPELIALMGEVEHHLHNNAEAEGLLLRALRKKPGLAHAHYGLSLVYYDIGRLEEALAQAQVACNTSKDIARFLAQLGLCHIATKGYGPAQKFLRQATLLEPNNIAAINNLGISLHAVGAHKEAIQHWQRALSLDPKYEPAIRNLTSSGLDAGSPTTVEIISGTYNCSTPEPSRLGRSTEELEEYFAEAPDDTENASELVKRHLHALQLEDARDVLTIALAHHPDALSLKLLQAKIAVQLRQFPYAESLYETILLNSPDNLEALLGLNQVLRDQCKYAESLQAVENAVAILENTDTLTQLAYSQVNACQYENALITCNRIESMQPNLSINLNVSRAVCHTYLGHFDEAKHWLEQAQQHPFIASGVDMFIGMIQLLHENFAAGWEGYQLRAMGDSEHQRLLPYPRWRGESLQGKGILILAEQGFGDQIMFASCLPDLIKLNPEHIWLEAHERVEKTLTRSFPDIHVFSSKQSEFDWLPPDITPDYYLPIPDLPSFFRNRIEDFPQHNGYLHADPERVCYWREKLPSDRPIIGFSWRGGVAKTRQAIRSLDLEQLLPLLSMSDICWVNLQYGNVSQELTHFTDKNGISILNFAEAIADLDEFSGLVSALDLVVTVCNTTVHYAGALGRTCWVMAPHVPEWRYGLTNTRMHWYPSTSMYRQPVNGDWSSVIWQVARDLDELRQNNWHNICFRPNAPQLASHLKGV